MNLDPAKLIADFGALAAIGGVMLWYMRRSLGAASKRAESDAAAQVARQSTEKVFDERLLRQLDERDETIRQIRAQYADDMKMKNAELADVNGRNRELNDRYYAQMQESMRLSAQAAVTAAEHNLQVIKAVSDARAEAHEATKRLHEKIEAQDARLTAQAAELVECKSSHIECTNRLTAIEERMRAGGSGSM